MKLTNVFNLTMVLGLALTVAATGCKKKPTPITQLPHGGPMGVADNRPFDPNQQLPPSNPFPPGPQTEITPTPQFPFKDGEIALSNKDRSHWPENRQILSGATVHFDFDKSSIRSSEQSKINEVANYLKNNPTHDVRVEGNCDERGTEEYNRSLGDRRALAAREALVRAGIDPDRIETVSFGEDKPVNPGHTEAAYAANRRADFVVLTPP